MDAALIIGRVARAIERHGLDAVMIGHAAAALQGACVTPLGIEFLVCPTVTNRKKLTAIASELGATLYRQVYPVSKAVRLMRDDQSLQVDFVEEAAGIRSFEELRAGAVQLTAGGVKVWANAMGGFTVKRTANPPENRPVPEDLEISPKRSRLNKRQRMELLAKECEWIRHEMVRRRVAAPIEHRTNFLRKRVGICSTAL